MELKKLKFQGIEYILVNERGDDKDGAIATQEQFDNFLDSFAHLMKDGRIMQHHQKIGDRSDIEWEVE